MCIDLKYFIPILCSVMKYTSVGYCYFLHQILSWMAYLCSPLYHVYKSVPSKTFNFKTVQVWRKEWSVRWVNFSKVMSRNEHDFMSQKTVSLRFWVCFDSPSKNCFIRKQTVFCGVLPELCNACLVKRELTKLTFFLNRSFFYLIDAIFRNQ